MSKHVAMVNRAALLAAGLVVAAGAQAASQKPLSLQEMVDLSDEIVVGRVVSAEARWRGNLIVTVSSVEVEEAIKGDGASGQGPRTIDITQIGGTAVHPRTGLRMTMSSSAETTLEPGSSVLLFVHRGEAGLRQIVGAQQGRYVIRENAKTGVREIPVGPKRLEVTHAPGRSDVETAVMTLDEMRNRIRSHLEKQRGKDAREAP